ncbi:MAG: methionine--tRNA ligase [bacterium]
MNNKVFLSTSIPYVNGEPHIGHCLEFVQTDVLARYYRQLHGSENVLFLSGADENALKNVLAAEIAGMSTQQYVNAKSTSFANLSKILNISFDDFIHTTESRHTRGAQKLWQAMDPNDIYQNTYSGLYCVGCEEFKKSDDLVDGLCPEHNKAPEKVEETNYFFRLSRYQKQIEGLIKSDTVKIVPEKRKNEVLGFLKEGLHDFSISRSSTRAKNWGVPVPGDNEQIMYVWVDALSNYITALGYADNSKTYQDYWLDSTKRLHVIGKGIVKFHALYWIGMLLSAKLPLPTDEFVHGYVTVEGNKIGKSLGNAIHPKEVVEKYGIDALRYFVLKEISAYGDGDFSWERMRQLYESDLQNGLGNLCARVATMASGMLGGSDALTISDVVIKALNNYQFDEALKSIWERVRACDQLINEKKVWKLLGNEKDVELKWLIEQIQQIAVDIALFLPETANKIITAYTGEIKKMTPLFPRLFSETATK